MAIDRFPQVPEQIPLGWSIAYRVAVAVAAAILDDYERPPLPPSRPLRILSKGQVNMPDPETGVLFYRDCGDFAVPVEKDVVKRRIVVRVNGADREPIDSDLTETVVRIGDFRVGDEVEYRTQHGDAAGNWSSLELAPVVRETISDDVPPDVPGGFHLLRGGQYNAGDPVPPLAAPEPAPAEPTPEPAPAPAGPTPATGRVEPPPQT